MRSWNRNDMIKSATRPSKQCGVGTGISRPLAKEFLLGFSRTKVITSKEFVIIVMPYVVKEGMASIKEINGTFEF